MVVFFKDFASRYTSFKILSEDLSNGIQNDHANYKRLIHYLLLSRKERELITGRCKCPVIAFGQDWIAPRIKDGKRRFSVLMYLGAKRIPVGMVKKQLDLAVKYGFKYHTEKE